MDPSSEMPVILSNSHSTTNNTSSLSTITATSRPCMHSQSISSQFTSSLCNLPQLKCPLTTSQAAMVYLKHPKKRLPRSRHPRPRSTAPATSHQLICMTSCSAPANLKASVRSTFSRHQVMPQRLRVTLRISPLIQSTFSGLPSKVISQVGTAPNLVMSSTLLLQRPQRSGRRMPGDAGLRTRSRKRTRMAGSTTSPPTLMVRASSDRKISCRTWVATMVFLAVA